MRWTCQASKLTRRRVSQWGTYSGYEKGETNGGVVTDRGLKAVSFSVFRMKEGSTSFVIYTLNWIAIHVGRFSWKITDETVEEENHLHLKRILCFKKRHLLDCIHRIFEPTFINIKCPYRSEALIVWCQRTLTDKTCLTSTSGMFGKQVITGTSLLCFCFSFTWYKKLIGWCAHFALWSVQAWASNLSHLRHV